VLIDDHALVLHTLAAILQDEPDLEIVGTATTIEEALRVTSETEPDVVVIDYRLPDGDGVTGARRIRQAVPGVKVVMLTARDDPATRDDALGAGCSGFVTKGAKLEQVTRAVRAAAIGPDPSDVAL
jgi:DNA-binding NarL/FixJ family response regulator